MSAEAKATHQPYIGPYKVLKSNNCILLNDKDGKEEFVHRGHVIKRIKRSPKQDDDVLELMLDEPATQPVAPTPAPPPSAAPTPRRSQRTKKPIDRLGINPPA
jgi:hypothetical protein